MATIALINANPFAFVGFALKLIYALPLFYLTYRIMSYSDTVSAKGVFDNPKYLNLVKTLISIISMGIAMGIKVPYLQETLKALTYIVGSWDKIGVFVTFIIGFCGNLYAIFATGDSVAGRLALKLGGDVRPKEKYFDKPSN